MMWRVIILGVFLLFMAACDADSQVELPTLAAFPTSQNTPETPNTPDPSNTTQSQTVTITNPSGDNLSLDLAAGWVLNAGIILTKADASVSVGVEPEDTAALSHADYLQRQQDIGILNISYETFSVSGREVAVFTQENQNLPSDTLTYRVILEAGFVATFVLQPSGADPAAYHDDLLIMAGNIRRIPS